MANKQTGIKKLASGRYQARYFEGFNAGNGKRIYVAKNFDTFSEARQWRAAEVAARPAGDIQSGRSITLGKHLDHWINTNIGLRDNNREAYRGAIERYIKPSPGNIKLTRLSATQIETWQAALLTHLSKTTVSYARTVLHSALESAKGKGMVRANVIEMTNGPGRAKSKFYPLKIEEALRLLAAAEGSRFGLVFEAMLTCGLRPEEVIGLKWSDL